MLEVSSSSGEVALGVDFVQIYSTSAFYQQQQEAVTRRDILIANEKLVPSCFFEHEHVVMNPTSAGMGYRHHRITCKFTLVVQFRRTSLTGFPTQSVRSSNAYALDSPYLLVLNTRTSQSRQHDMSESDSYYLSD
ncbi:hypothetical protein Tco_0299767 [Tanacetum coccineum]